MNNISPRDWLLKPIAKPSDKFLKAAQKRQSILTKPSGALGRLENIAQWFAACQSTEIPVLESIRVRVFAADHGVAIHGVSAFPQDVTAQMVLNFCAGGAAVTVLCEKECANFSVINMGCISVIPAHPNLINRAIASGTADFTQQTAMTIMQLEQALNAGREQVIQGEFQCFIGGEMGIGNTTSASALLAVVLNSAPCHVVGRGTGINDAGMQHKQKIIEQALTFHREAISSATQANDVLSKPLVILQTLGGFEIAALVGAYIVCAQRGIPIIIDGFISTAAAVIAVAIAPNTRNWMLFSHQSSEAGHQLALNHLKAEPLLNLGLRLGEGSGAVLVLGLIQSALALHKNMATFTEAGVSNG